MVLGFRIVGLTAGAMLLVAGASGLDVTHVDLYDGSTASVMAI